MKLATLGMKSAYHSTCHPSTCHHNMETPPQWGISATAPSLSIPPHVNLFRQLHLLKYTHINVPNRNCVERRLQPTTSPVTDFERPYPDNGVILPQSSAGYHLFHPPPYPHHPPVNRIFSPCNSTPYPSTHMWAPSDQWVCTDQSQRSGMGVQTN